MFLLILIASWVICFVVTYKIYYRDIIKDEKEFTDEHRSLGMFFASLHFIGVCIALCVLCVNFVAEQKQNPDSIFGKLVRKLEK